MGRHVLLLVLVSLSVGFGCGESMRESASSPEKPKKEAAKKYVLPERCTIDISAERGTEGEVLIVGSTNLPEGMRIGFEIPAGERMASQDLNVTIRGGRFRSAGFTKGKQPFPAGTHRVRVLSYFNGAWQKQDVVHPAKTGQPIWV